MTYTIQRNGGETEDFDGPILRAISFASSHNRRYELLDEQGRNLGVIDVGPMELRRTLEDKGFRLFGRLVEDRRVVDEWGYSFGLERIEREYGFRAQILTGPFHSANGGISDKARFVTIVGDRVPQELRKHPATSEAPAVRVADFPRRILVPAVIPDGVVGPMASGAYVIDDDHAWSTITGDEGPIPLHDRFETPAEYTVLSS